MSKVTVLLLGNLQRLGVAIGQETLFTHLTAIATVLLARKVSPDMWQFGHIEPYSPGFQASSQPLCTI